MATVAASVDELREAFAREYQSGCGKPDAMEEMRVRQEISHQLEKGLKDMRSLSGEISRHESSLAELQRFQSDVGTWLREKSSDVAELRSRFGDVKQEISGLAKASERQGSRLSEVESRTVADAKLAGAPSEPPKSLVGQPASTLREAEARIHNSQQELQQRLTVWQEELETNLTRELETLSAARGDLKQCFEDFAAEQRRSVAELRLESRAGIRSEASSLAALDEQLWLTDERLGRRIDELTSRFLPSQASSMAVAVGAAPASATADGQEVQVASALVAELQSGKPPNQPRWSALVEDEPEALARRAEERARKAGAAHSHSPARLRFKAQAVEDQ